MDEQLRSESERLANAWMRHDEGMLRNYLVEDVEDPRINIQSILSRHFLIAALFGDRFDALLEAELQFAISLGWAQTVLAQAAGQEDLAAVAHALTLGADNAEGVPVPPFVSKIFKTLPVEHQSILIPNYLRSVFELRGLAEPNGWRVPEPVMNTFQGVWASVLSNETARSVSVLEPACGSANDFRFLNAYGLTKLVSYAGFDICEKNIRNARQLFPTAQFEVGNVFDIRAADAAFDYGMVHDLFEHLSPAGLDQALAELCRVVRQGLCLGFFNLWEEPEHLVRPTEEYHWNTVSLTKVQQQLEERGFTVQPVHIDTLLRWRFGCDQTHNKNAYTLFAERSPKAFRHVHCAGESNRC